MHLPRVLFAITMPASSFGLIWYAALLAALAYAVQSARRSGLNPRSMYWAVTLSIVGGLWGGNLLGLLVHGWNGPMAVLTVWEGGKSWYGGAILGGLVGGLFFYFRKLPVLAYADASVPAVALGYCVGRLGCFLNGDDFGTRSHLPWAVSYPPGTEPYSDHLSRGWIASGASASLPIHPVQLYASFLGLALFVFLANWRPRHNGDRLSAFLVLYGAARFGMEQWLRGDFRAVVGPLSLPQIFSLLFIACGVGIWSIAHRRLTEQRPLEVATPISLVAGD